MLQADDALVASDANGGAAGPGHNMSPQAERFDHADDSGDLRLGSVGIHDDEHRRTSFSYATPIGASQSRAVSMTRSFNSWPLAGIRTSTCALRSPNKSASAVASSGVAIATKRTPETRT